MSKSIEGYQVVIDGKTRMVSDLTKEELQQEVIKMIDLFEAIHWQSDTMERLMEAFRRGKPVPEDLEPRP